MLLPIYLTLIYASGALSDLWIGSCKTSDNKCLLDELNNLRPIIADGIPKLGISQLDPLNIGVVYGNQPNLKFKLTNTTMRGYKNCYKKTFELNLDALISQYELYCPNLTITGYYEMDGNFGDLPVKGEGIYRILTTGYVIKLDMILKYGTDSNGKTYLIITESKAKQLKAVGPVKFEFNDLVNGCKDLSDPVVQYANKNWKYVVSLFEKPIASVCMKIIVNNFNKLLKIVPLESFPVPLPVSLKT